MDGNWCRAEAQPSLPSPTCFGTRGEPRDLCQLLEPEWLTRFFGMNRLTDLGKGFSSNFHGSNHSLKHI